MRSTRAGRGVLCGALVAIALAGCSSYYTDGDYFFVRQAGSDMPVWVTGEMSSDTMILFVHGGPGGDSSTASLFPAWQELEQHYSVAYWDQRASGLSQGNPDQSTFTVEQFVSDFDLVVDVLRLRYPSNRLVIFGHSWGGALAIAYLDDPGRQEKVEAVLIHDAGYNLREGLPSSGDWMQNYAQARIDAGQGTPYWRNLRDWLQTNPDFSRVENYRRLAKSYQVEGRADAYFFDPANKNIAGPDIAFIFASFASLALLNGSPALQSSFNILSLDLTDSLTRIETPALVLWGRHDGVNTLEMGEIAYDSLSTPASDKRFVVFENSGHQPFVEEPDRFVSEVRDFLDARE